LARHISTTITATMSIATSIVNTPATATTMAITNSFGDEVSELIGPNFVDMKAAVESAEASSPHEISANEVYT